MHRSHTFVDSLQQGAEAPRVETMRGHGRIRLVGAFVLMGFSCALQAAAQTAATGALAGIVTDASGGVIPGVLVTVTDLATGTTRTANTDPDGHYRVTLLPPGGYSLEFAISGFKTETRRGVVVNVAETHTLNVVVQVGDLTDNVVVDANAALVQNQTTTLGSVVSEATVKTLPLTTRNYTQILGLAPGVVSDVTNAGELGRNTADVFVHGMRTLYNNYQMDGAEINNFASGRGGEFLGYSGIAIPNPDAIQEFKIQTGLYDAGYGKAVGANVNVVTRSGGNTYRGTAFEFFRNEALNANDFFLKQNDQPKPLLRQNQFGGSLGGPILKGKLFFFTSYQGTRQKNGIGSRSLQSAFLPPLTDDRTAATLGRQFCGQSGALGGVAVACDGSNINPVAVAMLNAKIADGTFFIPTPQVIRPDGLGFSVFSIPSQFTEDHYLVNLDYQLSQNQRLSGRWFYARSPQNLAFTTSNVPGSGADAAFGNRNLVLRLNSVVTPKFLNTATFAFSRHIGDLQTQTPVKVSDVGMTPSADREEIPTIDVEGLFSVGGNFNDNLTSFVSSFQFSDEISWVRGRHNIRAGFRYEHIRDDFDIPGVKRGSLFYLSFPDFLLGLSAEQNGSSVSNVFSSFGIGGFLDREWRVNNYATFFQDDITVHPRLTLNLGVRWDVLGLVSDAQGRLANFWPELADNNFPPGGTLEGFVVPTNFPKEKFPLPPGVGSTGNKTPLKNGAPLDKWGPRLGVTWQPFAKTQRVVLRGGFGLFYAQASGDHFAELLLNPPFVSFFVADGVTNRRATSQVPFNPGPSAVPVWEPRTATSELTVSNFASDYDAPRAQHFSANVQYEFVTDFLLELGYVGVRGSRIVRGRQINQPFLASPENPVNGVTTNTVANASQRVPLLGFTPRGLNQRETNGSSIYNALESSVTKRFSKGLMFKASYTWGKAVDEVSGTTGAGAAFTGGFTGDVRNPRQMRGPADFNRPHRFVFSYVWELPLHNGDGPGLAATLLGGWQLAGLVTLQSGTSLTILDQRSGSIYGFSRQRAHLCPGSSPEDIATEGSVGSRLDNFFNPSVFCAPPVIGDGFDFGTLGRGVVKGPDQRNVDIALIKRTRVGGLSEEANVEFRVELFNALNTPQFANPGTLFPSATFGRITATSVAPRIIQLAVKYSF